MNTWPNWSKEQRKKVIFLEINIKIFNFYPNSRIELEYLRNQRVTQSCWSDSQFVFHTVFIFSCGRSSVSGTGREFVKPSIRNVIGTANNFNQVVKSASSVWLRETNALSDLLKPYWTVEDFFAHTLTAIFQGTTATLQNRFYLILKVWILR